MAGAADLGVPVFVTRQGQPETRNELEQTRKEIIRMEIADKSRLLTIRAAGEHRGRQRLRPINRIAGRGFWAWVAGRGRVWRHWSYETGPTARQQPALDVPCAGDGWSRGPLASQQPALDVSCAGDDWPGGPLASQQHPLEGLQCQAEYYQNILRHLNEGTCRTRGGANTAAERNLP